jgi:hypothetical protein
VKEIQLVEHRRSATLLAASEGPQPRETDHVIYRIEYRTNLYRFLSTFTNRFQLNKVACDSTQSGLTENISLITLADQAHLDP